MAANGQLVFTDVDKVTFKGVGNTSNAVIDTTTGKIGVGVDSPDANLHVLGNCFVSTNLELGGTMTMGTVTVNARHELSAITATGNTTPHTVEFQNATTGLVTTGNVSVGKDLTVAGNVAVDTDTLFVDSVNDRVGIGTDNPDKKLHVYTTASESNSQLFLQSANRYATMQMSDDSGGVMVQNDQGDLRLLTGFDASMGNGSETMRIKDNGNVGIGTTDPVSDLHVTSGTNDGTTLINLVVNQSSDATVYYRKIAYVSNNSGHVLIKGILGGHTQSQGNATVDVKFSMRDGFTALGTCMGTLGNSNILVKDNTSDNRQDIYLVTGHYSYVNLQVYAIGGEVFGTNENGRTTTAPSGTTTHDLKLNFTTFRVDDDGNVGIGTTNPSASFHNNGNKAILNQQLGLQTVNVYKTAGGNSGAQTKRYYRVYVPNGYTNFQIIFRGFARNYIGSGDIQDWRRQYTVQRNSGAGVNIVHDSGEDINASGFTFATSQTGSASETIEIHFDVTFPAKPEYATYITFSAETVGDSGSFAETSGI